MGWIFGPIADVAIVEMGQSPPSTTYNSNKDGLPFFQGKAGFGDLYPDVRMWCSHPQKIALPNDILLSIRAPVGPTNIAPVMCCIGRGLAAIRPEHGLTLKYLLYALRRYADELDARGTGTTFKAISCKTLRDFPIPIAPSGEQTRIAEALEELFADLDAGVAALERARDRLTRYRASVLKAAVGGTLTADWRAAHPNVEPASELLKRILTERRRRWEENQLRKFAEKDKGPSKNWRSKYKEPAAPHTSTLPPLPDGWCWATVDQCSSLIQYGSSSKTGCDSSGIPVLRMGNITAHGRLILEDLKYLQHDHDEFPELLLEKGDLIFNRTNSAELVGKTAEYSGDPSPCSFASYLIRVRLLEGIASAIVLGALNGGFGKAWIKRVVNQTVGQANVNGSKLASFVFPLPPAAEQDAVVEAVEDQLSIVDHLDTNLAAKLKSAQRLHQAVLRHAFSGKLVSQDPNDGSASELLKRIADEREARAREAAAAKRAARNTDGLRIDYHGQPTKRKTAATA